MDIWGCACEGDGRVVGEMARPQKTHVVHARDRLRRSSLSRRTRIRKRQAEGATVSVSRLKDRSRLDGRMPSATPLTQGGHPGKVSRAARASRCMGGWQRVDAGRHLGGRGRNARGEAVGLPVLCRADARVHLRGGAHPRVHLGGHPLLPRRLVPFHCGAARAERRCLGSDDAGL